MDDLISKQAAIDALERIFDRCEEIEAHLPDGDPDKEGYRMYPDYMTVWEYLKKLPSAQPEIIYCEDCKNCQREDYDVWISKEVYDTRTSFWCRKLRDVDQEEQIEVMLDDYCSWAERRTDE